MKTTSFNILILDSGGRGTALAQALRESSKNNNLLGSLYVAPGNAGTALVAENVPIGMNDFEALKIFCLQKEIDVIIPGSEEPLANGIKDFFANDLSTKSICVAGPTKAAAQIESSKSFAKGLMQKNGIPTADYQVFTLDTIAEGFDFIDEFTGPVVLKADGLAGGKGVIICKENGEAKETLKAMLEGKFGAASATVVVEEFLEGIEFSVFVLTNGVDYFILPVAKDYKMSHNGNTGLNTGGTGVVSPLPFITSSFMQKVEGRIIRPILQAMQNEKTAFAGFLYGGLIKVGDDPFVIEFNCRLGDPETELSLLRCKTNFLELLLAYKGGTLKSVEDLGDKAGYKVAVVIMDEGYPETVKHKGRIIEPSDPLLHNSNFIISGLQMNAEGKLVVTSGRIGVCIGSDPSSLAFAKRNADENAEIVMEALGPGFRYRTDIGDDIISLQSQVAAK